MSIIIQGKEYYGIIYKIENIITHEIYIGQTTNKRGFAGRYNFKGQGIERVHKYLQGNLRRNESHNQYLRRSIEKFGYESFVVDEVFDVALTQEELNQKETYYICYYDSYKHGYNMSFGGDNAAGYPRPKGKDCPNSKRICQIGLDGTLIRIWDSATEAHEQLGVCSSTVSCLCNHRSRGQGYRPKTAGGYVWVFEKDYDPHQDYSCTRQKKDQGRGTKPVLLLSTNGEILQEFYSVNSAGEALGISGQEVSRICSHKAKTIKYNVVYKSEYLEEQRLSERGLTTSA